MIFDEDADEAVADEKAADEEPEAEEAEVAYKGEPDVEEEPKCPGCDGRTFVEGTDPNTGKSDPRLPTVTCPTCRGTGKPKAAPAPTAVETSVVSERAPSPPEEPEEELDPQVPPENGASVVRQPTELAEAEAEEAAEEEESEE